MEVDKGGVQKRTKMEKGHQFLRKYFMEGRLREGGKLRGQRKKENDRLREGRKLMGRGKTES